MKAQTPSDPSHCFPSEMISHAIRQYRRFCLSFREVKERLAAVRLTVTNCLTVTYETVRVSSL